MHNNNEIITIISTIIIVSIIVIVKIVITTITTIIITIIAYACSDAMFDGLLCVCNNIPSDSVMA